MYHYKAVISYKGTNYFGWQIQPNTTETIQGKIVTALKIICKSSEVKILASGRTDTGVHAIAQVARIVIPIYINPESLKLAINANLPEDIRIKDAQECEKDFNPISQSKKKEYRYRFTNTREPNPHSIDYFVNISYELDFEKMNEACKLMIGDKDFSFYYTLGSDSKTTVRTIFECEIIHVPGVEDIFPDHYYLRIVGSGFLKQMVRLIMGTIWNVGKGKVTLEEFTNSLKGQATGKLGAVAPPNGLFLHSVTYN